MATLRPPSTSPSPSPAPGATGSPNKAVGSRASMGPTARLGGSTASGQLASPRPAGFVGSARPTSELPPGVNGNTAFQTPESEALDQWFENLQSYEATLEEMAAASLDVNFKEELSAIEQWFRVLSEAERTAALYSLLQHSTQVQIRFFITVLQQMARSDPMTAALLSPGMGGKSMEQQMENKLAQLGLKSPALKTPASPSARTFGNLANKRQSLALDNTSNFLSPDSAALAAGGDAAATLAAQRAKLNAAHRISAPPLAVPTDNRANWNNNQLGQVAEQSPPADAQELTIPAPNTGIRPKSTDFSGLANALSPRFNRSSDGGEDSAGLSPMPQSKNWASMVNTPMDTLFPPSNKQVQSLDAASQKLANWSGGDSNGRIMLEGVDKFKYRRNSARSVSGPAGAFGNGDENEIYDDNGNLLGQSNSMGSIPQGRKTSGSVRSTSGASNFGGQNWNSGGSVRSPAMSNTSGRFDDGTMSGLGLGVGGFNIGGGMSPGLGMGMPAGFPAVSPLMGGPGFDINMLNNMANLNLNGMGGVGGLNAMNLANQQLLAQMAAAQMQNQLGYGMQQQFGNNRSRGGRPSGGGSRPAMSDRGKSEGGDDVDPKLLEDVPAWLRSLRLHKYTPNFEGSNWKDMVLMDEAALEAKGVAALGARRKMLKTFELVRNKMNFHPIEKTDAAPGANTEENGTDASASGAAAPAEAETAASA